MEVTTRRYFSLFCLLRLAIATSGDQQPFRLSTYPKTPTDALCGHEGNTRLCDPDGILLDNNSLLSSLFEDNLETRNVTVFGTDVPVQYGVALMRKMDLETTNDDAMDMFHDEPEKAAEVFGRHIHDEWGVGGVSYGTGVLIFLSIDDRVVYISRGVALTRILSDRRLDAIVQHMRPLLREEQYDQAIVLAVSELDAYLQAGESLWERLHDWLEKSIIFVVLGVVGWLIRKDFVARREYTRVASQLSALDQARAEALQGSFKTTSCPICLEDFKKKEVAEGEEETESLQGSDGLELKLLRCGHVFDETCWNEWINSGHHRKIDKCPICQQDVGPSTEQQSRQPATADPLSIPRGGHSNEERIYLVDNAEETDAAPEHARDLALRRYTQDRNFRLMRMAARYPQYIERNQLQRWTQVSYNGSMANDSQLARQAASQTNVRDSCSSGFGGGVSSGGRGGRW